MTAREADMFLFYRAFDICRYPMEGLQGAIDLEIHTILTSGQKNDCMEGGSFLKELCRERRRVRIMA